MIMSYNGLRLIFIRKHFFDLFFTLLRDVNIVILHLLEMVKKYSIQFSFEY